MKTVNDIKLQKDQDLYVRMLANDPKHLARAKAKAAKVHARRRVHKKKEKANLGPAACAFLAFLGLGALSLSFFL